MMVVKMAEVRVAADTFETVKIEAYDNKSGRLEAEYWYSQTAKWFVKVRNYGIVDGFVRLGDAWTDSAHADTSR